MASTSPSPSASSADNSTSPSPSNTGSSPAAPSPSVPSNSSTSSSSSSSSSSSTPTPTPSSTPSDTSPSPSPSPTDSSSSSTLPSSTTASPSTTPSPTNSSTSPAVDSTDHSTSPSVTPPTVVVSTVTAPDGHTFTSTLTLPGPTDIGSHSSDTSKSASHTGAIVGGVVGGIVALLLLVLGVLLYIRHRRRLEDEAFDGNFDPDRIIRPASGPGTPRGRGPTLPNIPLTGSDEQLGPRMSELDDDGMGGRLNSAAIGAGVVSPYPLYSPTSPLRSTASPPPSAGHSSDAQHSVYGAQMADWRGPSPGLSIPTQYTGGSGNSPPSSYPPSSNMAHLPPGAAPGPGGPGIAATAYGAAGFAGGRHSRRPSAGTSSSRERPIYADNGSSSAGSGDMHNGGRFGIANPDEIMVHNRSFSETARRAYMAGGPSGKSPTGPPQVPPREVLVHQDGGRIENNDSAREPEGPEEIPPTYDSILDAAGMASRSMPEKRRRF